MLIIQASVVFGGLRLFLSQCMSSLTYLVCQGLSVFCFLKTSLSPSLNVVAAWLTVCLSILYDTVAAFTHL